MNNYERYQQFCKENINTNEETFFKKLEELFGVGACTALDIWYAPQRSWFKPEMIDELIRLDNPKEEGFRPFLSTGEFVWDDSIKQFLPENKTLNERYEGSNHASLKPEQFSLSKLEELLTDKEEIILKYKVAVVSADSISIVLPGNHNIKLTHEEIDKIYAASMKMRGIS